MTPRDEILKTVADWQDAFVRADLEAILSLYADNATFIGTSSSRFHTASKDLRDYFSRAMLERTPSTAQFLECAVQELGPVAVMTALDRISWSDGAGTVSLGRVTFVLQRLEPGWRIVSFHRSEIPTL